MYKNESRELLLFLRQELGIKEFDAAVAVYLQMKEISDGLPQLSERGRDNL